jgi:hypothetical protein
MSAARDFAAASLRLTTAHRQAMGAALGVAADPYALAPFVMIEGGRAPRLAVALSPPPLFDADALGAWHANPQSDVIVIDWRTGEAALLGDPGAWLCGDPIPRHTMRLFTDGRAFARQWAAARLAHVNRYRAAKVPGLMASDAADGCLPGYIITGRLEAVASWAPLLGAARVVIDNPALVRKLNGLLIRAAGVPSIATGAALEMAA